MKSGYVLFTAHDNAELTALPQRRLKAQDLIYKSSYEGWYAVSDETYYSDQQVAETIDSKSGEKFMVRRMMLSLGRTHGSRRRRRPRRPEAKSNGCRKKATSSAYLRSAKG